MVPGVESSPLLTEILDPIAIAPSREEQLRYLGYPAAAAGTRPMRSEIERQLQLGQPLLRPKAMYSLYRVEARRARELTLGTVTIQGKIAEFLAPADHIVVFAATVGVEITQRSSAASSAGDSVASWVFDALGSCAAEAAANALSLHLRRRFPLDGAVSERFSPGYCGMQLSQQAALFKLIDATAIGVSLQDTMLMQPTKSVSGLLGISAAGAFAKGNSPCERCNDVNCPMRR